MSSSDEMKLKPTHYTKMHYVGWKSLNIERSKKYIVDTWFDSIMQWCWLCHQAPSGDWPFFYADAQCWSLSRQLSSCPSRPPLASCWLAWVVVCIVTSAHCLTDTSRVKRPFFSILHTGTGQILEPVKACMGMRLTEAIYELAFNTHFPGSYGTCNIIVSECSSLRWWQ